MGQPSEMTDTENTSENATDTQESTETASNSQTDPVDTTATAPRKRLYRNINNKVFGGVISGLAMYLGWEANVMRILYILLIVILAPVTVFWPFVILYLIAWMVIPAANTPRRILEMQGSPVTIDTIGQNVLSSSVPPQYNGSQTVTVKKGILESALSILGKCLMGFIGLIGTAGALVATGFFMFFVTALIAYTGFNDATLIDSFNPHACRAPITGCLTVLFTSLSFLIPAIAIAWTSASVLFNCKGASKAIIIMAIVLELLFILSAIVFSIFSNRYMHF